MKKFSNINFKYAIPMLIFLLVFLLSNITYAVDVNEVISKVTTPPEKEKVGEIMGNAMGIALTIGGIIAAVMMVVIAIKYLASSPNEKAELKKYLIPYMVGAILVFASSGIIGFIANLINESVNK